MSESIPTSSSATPAPVASGATTVPSTKHSIKRILCFVLLGFCLLFGWYFVRGTWAASKMVDPTTPEQGVIAKLVLSDDGHREIRTAVVIPVSIDQAWRILSDYDEWEKMFKTVRRKQRTEPLEGNRRHVVSDVMTPMGTISLDFIVTHEETPDGGYLAWWDAPTRELPINKGTIRITPHGANQTLFVYTVRKKYQQYPEFLVNNMLLKHQPDIVSTLRLRMIEAAKE
ncbi:MAG: SRPBCC family protein [Planctomycetaceae bacterium]